MSFNHCTQPFMNGLMSASDDLPLRLPSRDVLDITTHTRDLIPSRCLSTTDRVEASKTSRSSATRRKPSSTLYHATKHSAKSKMLTSIRRTKVQTLVSAIGQRRPSNNAQFHQTASVTPNGDADWPDPYDIDVIKYNTRFLIKELKPGSERDWEAQPVSITMPKGDKSVNTLPYASRPDSNPQLGPSNRKPESESEARDAYVEDMSSQVSRLVNAEAKRTSATSCNESGGVGGKTMIRPQVDAPVGIQGKLLSTSNSHSTLSTSTQPTGQHLPRLASILGPARRRTLLTGVRDEASRNRYRTLWQHPQGPQMGPNFS